MKTINRSIVLILLATSYCFAEDNAAKREEIWKKIEPLFTVPAEFKDKLAPHRSLLKFDDGTEVKTADDWKKRRAEILAYWHKMLGPWPAAIEKPKIEFLEKESLPEFTRHKVKVE